ncbi:MAG: LysR substrate-binding domain-containing protein, partial [Armatimonadota bacterium]|nr:LysR substrate-binding domain-containing protein [Armatimonadota bacterium]
RILDAYARRILALVEEANEAIEELKDLHRGHLAVGASTTPGIYLVPRALGEFRKRYPEVEIRLEVGSPPRIQQLLLSNDLDLGVMAGQPGSRDLVAEPFLEDELVAVVPPRHRLASQGVVRVEDFLQETVLLRERGSETRQVVDEALRQRGIHLPKVLEMTSPEAMKQAAASGLGIGLLSKYTIRLEVSAGLLVVLPIADLPMRRSFFLVRHRDKRLSRAAQVFVEILKAMHPQETLVGTPATE